MNPDANTQLNYIIGQMKNSKNSLKDSLKLSEVKINRRANSYTGVLGSLTGPIVKIINNPVHPIIPLIFASSEDSGFSYLTDFEYMDMNQIEQINRIFLTDPSNLGSSVPTNTSQMSSVEANEALNLVDAGSIPASSSTVAIGGASCRYIIINNGYFMNK